MSLCKVGNQTSSQDPQAVNSRIFVGNLNTFQVTKTDVEKVSLSIHSILKVPSFPFCHLTFHQLLFFLIKHLFQAQAGAISFFKLQLLNIYFYVSGLKNSVELFTQSEALEWQFKSLGTYRDHFTAINCGRERDSILLWYRFNGLNNIF